MSTPAIIALVITFVLAGAIDRLARTRRWAMLAPRARDIHGEATPRLGGVAIFLGFFVTALFWHAIRPADFAAFGFPFAIFGLSIDKQLLGILLGALVLSGVMIIDDIKGLSFGWKLAGQIAAGLIVIAASVNTDFIRLPFGAMLHLDIWQIPIQIGAATYHIKPLGDLFVLFWLVLLMNAVNFVDGLDGLATSLGSVATLTIVLLALSETVAQPAVALLGFIFLGALCGFLPWNWHKARLFLGDTGAGLIGYILGVLSVISGSKIATLGLVLVIPILDLLYVVICRLLKHQNPFKTADQNHLHHRLIKLGLSTPQAVLAYTAVAAAIGILAISTSTLGKTYVFLAATVIIAALFTLLTRALSQKEQSAPS